MRFVDYYHRLKSVLGLSFSLAKANFKLRNEGSYLGVLWYLLEPLLMFLIIILVRANITTESIENYPIYLLTGLIMFNFFRGATVLSASIMRNNSEFVKSMNIPKESLVVSNVLQSIFSHIFEIMVLFIFLVFFGNSIKGLFLYPIIFVFFVFFVLGISFILSIIGVYINDISNVWNIITRLLWFATPIFYVLTTKTKIFFINLFNPMFYFITGARDFIISASFPENFVIFGILGFSFFSFVLGFLIFEKYKNKIAEEL
ncbi:MAG: ABC transporter permease [Nanoarchaeota archaeon]|nr:ABC transporter permease [Nanoarchaeota archaeon]